MRCTHEAVVMTYTGLCNRQIQALKSSSGTLFWDGFCARQEWTVKPVWDDREAGIPEKEAGLPRLDRRAEHGYRSGMPHKRWLGTAMSLLAQPAI